MPHCDYPIDVRADYPARSSRGWAVLTILLIKLIALFPHYLVLVFLGIAQAVVAFVAEVMVAFRGEYPPRSSRVYAAFTVVVEVFFVATVI